MNNETLFNLLLPHLSLDVVYRFYPFSSVLRRMVDNRFYWLKLIDRDLKIVPQFEIDAKLYYLRLMNYPIAATLISSYPTTTATMHHIHRSGKVLQYLEGMILYRNNKIEYKGKIISLPESIKFLRIVLTKHYAISYSGNIYNLGAHTPTVPVDTFGSEVLDMGMFDSNDLTGTVAVITHQGGLKLLSFLVGIIDTLIHSLDMSSEVDSKVIQLHGKYMMTEKGMMYMMADVNRNCMIRLKKKMCRALLPSPFFSRNKIMIATKMLNGNEGTPLIYDPYTGEFIIKKYKSTLFVDPLGRDLFDQSFNFYLGNRPILEVCDSHTSELILRTI